ncbi:unnamed protein product, partial [Oppiella nova]
MVPCGYQLEYPNNDVLKVHCKPWVDCKISDVFTSPTTSEPTIPNDTNQKPNCCSSTGAQWSGIYERHCCYQKEKICSEAKHFAQNCADMSRMQEFLEAYDREMVSCRGVGIDPTDTLCNSMSVNDVTEPECQQWFSCCINDTLHITPPPDTSTTRPTPPTSPDLTPVPEPITHATSAFETATDIYYTTETITELETDLGVTSDIDIASETSPDATTTPETNPDLTDLTTTTSDIIADLTTKPNISPVLIKYKSNGSCNTSARTLILTIVAIIGCSIVVNAKQKSNFQSSGSQTGIDCSDTKSVENKSNFQSSGSQTGIDCSDTKSVENVYLNTILDCIDRKWSPYEPNSDRHCCYYKDWFCTQAKH